MPMVKTFKRLTRNNMRCTTTWVGALVCSLMGTACDSLQGKAPVVLPDDYVFPGAASLTPSDDGTFSLSWPVSPLGESTYAVFSREDGKDFDFSKPLVKLKETLYKTQDMRFLPKSCYVVRFSTDTYKGDKNTNELCTPPLEFKFPGVTAVTRQDDGTYLIKWAEAPFKKVIYQLFEADPSGSVASAPLRSLPESTSRVGPYPLGTVKCFVVRMTIDNRTDVDANSITKCTEENRLKSFIGVEQVDSPDTGKAFLKWTPADSDDVIGYIVYQGPNFGQSLTKVEGRTTNTFTLSNLPTSKDLTFGVRALTKFGTEDTNTREMSVTVKDLRPLIFEGLQQASVTSKSEATLAWLPHTQASEYRIYRAQGPLGSQPEADFSKPILVVPAASGAKAKIPGLGDDMVHSFVVRAVSVFGVEESNSTAKYVTIPDAGAPAFRGVKSAVVRDGKVVLNWDPALGQVTRYRVFFAKGSPAALDYTSTAVPFEPGTSTTSIVSGFQSNQQYSFAVRAEDRNGAIDTNTIAATITVGGQSLPEFFGYNSSVALDNKSVRMTFNTTPSGDVKSYRIRTRRAGTTNWIKTQFMGQDLTRSSLTLVIDELLEKTEYETLVNVIDNWGNESNNTQVSRSTTLDLTPPAFNGVVSADQTTGDSEIRLTWDSRSSVDLDHYRVYWAPFSLGSYNLHSKSSLPVGVSLSSRIEGTALGTSFATLAKGQTFYFVVHAVDNAGNEDTNTVQVNTVVANTFPGLGADATTVRSPQAVPMVQVTLTASDPDLTDTLTYSQVSTTCPGAFSQPVLTELARVDKLKTAHVNWTPTRGFIGVDQAERSCTVTYKVTDGTSDSPMVVLTLTAFNRIPKNVVATLPVPTGGFARNKNLTCAVSADDDDGDLPTYTFAWQKNGIIIGSATTSTLTPAVGAFKPADVVECLATAYDGHARVTATSPSVTFSNTPPSAVSTSVSEDGGTSPLLVTDRVACQWSATDADSDALTFGAVSIEQSVDGGTTWTAAALESTSCAIVQSNKQCYSMSPSVRHSSLRCKVASVTDSYTPNTTPGVSGSLAVANTSPKVNSVALTPTTGLEAGTALTCIADISDADNDSLTTPPTLQWTRNSVAISGATGTTYTLQPADRNLGVRCEITISANADANGSGAVGPIKSSPVTYTNSNPRQTNVTVTPTSGVLTGTLLTCNPTFTDPDGDSIVESMSTVAYQWTADDGVTVGNIAGATGKSFTVTGDLRNKAVRCQTTILANADANGSSAVGPTSSSNNVIPINSAPVISNVTVSASANPVLTNTVLSCNSTITDLDGDSLVSTPKYVWRAANATLSGATSQTYSVKRSDRTKAITCSVELGVNADGKGSQVVAAVLSSNSLTSINSEPILSNVLLNADVSAPYYPGQKISCSGSSTDLDADPLLPQYRWYNNNVEIPGATLSDYYATTFDRNASVRCSMLLPFNADGYNSAALEVLSGNAYVIQNRAPVSNFAPVLEVTGGASGPYVTSSVRCRLPTNAPNPADPDLDSVTYKYIWRKNGVLFSGTAAAGTTTDTLSLSTDTTISPSNTLTCVLALSDGLLTLNSNSSSALTVQNRAPTPVAGQTVSVSPGTAYRSVTTTSLSCDGGTFEDLDGDAISYTYDWRKSPTAAGNPVIIATAQPTKVLAAGDLASGKYWDKTDFIACSIKASDASGATVITAWPGASNPNISASGVTILNQVPTGTLTCNGGVTTIVAYPGNPIVPTSGCSGITDPDGDIMSYFFDTDPANTTCTGLGTKITVNSTNGSIGGVVPDNNCQVGIKTTDNSGAIARTTLAGPETVFIINFQTPFLAKIGTGSLDNTCKLTFPTTFQNGETTYGSSSYSFSALVQTPKSHTNPHTTSGLLSGTLSTAGGGGSVSATWNITGTNAAYFSSIVKNVRIEDSPDIGAIPTDALSAVGLQTSPLLDVGGTQSAGCALGTCSGRLSSIAAGDQHACAIAGDNDLYCWGDNTFGSLGNGVLAAPLTYESPNKVSFGNATYKASMVSAGGMSYFGSSHTCAVVEDQSTTPATNKGVYCWGENTHGQLGRGNFATTPVGSGTPTQVSGLTGGTGTDEVIAVAAGGAHTCALMKAASPAGGGAVKCWGENEAGQLGDGTLQAKASPGAVTGFATAGAKGIVAGGRHTCAITNVNTVQCWGANNNDQLGFDRLQYGTYKTAPTEVTAIGNDVVALAAGDNHTCALKATGAVKCWGSTSSGQGGNNFASGTHNEPMPIVGGIVTNAVSISAGATHTCALLATGAVSCWGANGSGQLGNNTLIPSSIPVDMLGLNYDVVAMETGGQFSCILRHTGALACFGNNSSNQLGVPPIRPYKKPEDNTMPMASVTPVVPSARLKSCRVLRAIPQ